MIGRWNMHLKKKKCNQKFGKNMEKKKRMMVNSWYIK